MVAIVAERQLDFEGVAGPVGETLHPDAEHNFLPGQASFRVEGRGRHADREVEAMRTIGQPAQIELALALDLDALEAGLGASGSALALDDAAHRSGDEAVARTHEARQEAAGGARAPAISVLIPR